MRSIRIILVIFTLAMAASIIGGCSADKTSESDQASLSVRTTLSERTDIQAIPLAGGYLGFPHWVDVYINDAMECFTVGNRKIEGDILLFEGDYLIYNNIGNDNVTLKLPEGWFEETEVTIEPNKRKALKVIIKGPAAAGIISVKGTNQKLGSPNMKVGEEP